MNKASKVVPAILTDDPKALELMVRQAEGFTDYVQFDIMDGRFVPSRSITHEHLASLPMKFRWEAHLMVEEPEGYLEDFQEAGANKIVFHYEATSSPLDVISQVRGMGLKVGLAINPETSLTAVSSLIGQIDSILLLTVNPGFYGSPFLPEVLDKIPEIRHIRPQIEIGVDGGIKESNIAEVAQRGVDIICVGSAVFLQPQPSESFRHLQVLVERGRQH